MRRWCLIALVPLLGGCDLFEDRIPDEARLFLSGEPGARVHVVTSVVFVAGVTLDGITRVQLIEADTLVRTLPFDTTYSVRGQYRFFAEVARLDEDLPQFRMRVRVDERPLFDEDGPLQETPFRFVYTFNQRTTREIELI